VTAPDDRARLAEREASLSEALKFARVSLSRLAACPAEPRAEVVDRVRQLERELEAVRQAVIERGQPGFSAGPLS